jgi:hypothetical protein
MSRVKKKRDNKKNKVIYKPYQVQIQHMPEMERAKLIDDVLVYISLADDRIPKKFYLSEHCNQSLFLKAMNAAEPVEHISLLRPGYGCRLAIDSIRPVSTTRSMQRIRITERKLFNDGDVRTKTHTFQRSQDGNLTHLNGAEGQIAPGQSMSLAHPDQVKAVKVVGPDVYAYCILSTGLAAQYRINHTWTVMANTGLAECGICSDPGSLREMFKLREKAEGRTRKAALLHLVTGHWRRAASSVAEDRIYIERYLRGATSFEWFGMECMINGDLNTWDDIGNSIVAGSR